jgi:putative ABC transport system permease protein
VLAIAGIAAGLVLSYAAGRAMESLLAGVKPADPVTFIAAICLCLLMALLGSLAPAIKAVKIDPISAIRID